MIEIKIPKEITEYKEKFLFGLTVRQCVSIAAALGVAIPLYIFGKDYLGADVAGWLVILVVVPVFGFGFLKYNGMTFERLAAMIYRQKFAEPQKRKYEELPVFYHWREEVIANEIAYQTARTAYANKKRKRKGADAVPKKVSTQKNAKSAENISAKATSSEVEIPVFGVGSLNVKWKKKKGCTYEKEERKQQRKGKR